MEVLASYGPRDLEQHPEALELARAHVKARFVAAGYAVRELPYEVEGQRVVNLEATLRGHSLPGEVVVLGAPYDTVPTTPGADDNASGIAGLLEIARIAAGQKFGSTIQFIAFGLEEAGLLRRAPVASDRRGIQLVPTDGGLSAISLAATLEPIANVNNMRSVTLVTVSSPTMTRRLFTGSYSTASMSVMSLPVAVSMAVPPTCMY